MLKTFYTSLLSLLSIAAFSQQYEIEEIAYTNDPLVEDYFANQDEVIQWKGLMRSEYEQQTKSMTFSFMPEEDTLFVAATMGSREMEMAFPESAPNVYEYTSRRKFWRIFMDDENPPRMVQGRYKSLKEGSSGADLEALKDKYGDKAEVFVTTLMLKEMDAEAQAINVTKAYEVVGVKLMVNEDVMDFAEENRTHFMGYNKANEERLRKTYMNNQFQVTIEGKRARIKSINDENSSFSFSSTLEQPKKDVYRIRQYNSFWDFYVEEGAEEEFKAEQLNYVTFIQLKESDKEAEDYQKLKKKYGEFLPYNTIVQELKEIETE
jgi:hypothetical protein